MIHLTSFPQIARRALLTLLLGLLSLPATASLLTSSDGLHPDGYALPGLRPAGYPNFETGVSVRWRQLGNAGYLLHVKDTDKNSNLLNLSPSLEHSITNSKYHLLARLDATGNLISGNLLITGRIPDMGIPNGGILMTAQLGEFNFSDHLLGFNTTGIVCPKFDFCTQNESVYISLADSFSMDLKNLKTTGLAVTTVPLPAAAWLLGGGLIGLIGIGKRKRQTRAHTAS